MTVNYCGILTLSIIGFFKLQRYFYNIGPWGQYYKTPDVRKLRIFAQSVCYTSVEKVTKGKHSGLLRKFVNYVRKKFYNIGPCYHIHNISFSL
jgi:hypothetical protein